MIAISPALGRGLHKCRADDHPRRFSASQKMASIRSRSVSVTGPVKADRLGLRERRPSSGIDRPAPSHVATKSLRKLRAALHSPDGESRAAATRDALSESRLSLKPHCRVVDTGAAADPLAPSAVEIAASWVSAGHAGCTHGKHRVDGVRPPQRLHDRGLRRWGVQSRYRGSDNRHLVAAVRCSRCDFYLDDLGHARACRAHRSWIDRFGRAIGIYWIVAALFTIVAMATR